MGTHPIFESDFDCLTELNLSVMSLNGAWKKVKTENEAEFGAAIGATPEMAAVSAIGASYAVAGNDITIKRTYSTPAGEQEVTNSGSIGSEAEYSFLGNKIQCQLSGSDGDLTVKATSGWATVSIKVNGNELRETITHHESGVSMTNIWERALTPYIFE